MRHPFDGILGPSAPTAGVFSATTPERCSTRRSFFGKMLTVAVGAWGLLSGRSEAQDFQQPTDSNSGAVDPGRNGFDANWGQGQMTTQALGEEGAGFPAPPNDFLPDDGPVTTYALGEEGSYTPPPGRATTYALGEEAGYYPPRRRGYYYLRSRFFPPPWYGSPPRYRRDWY